MSAKRVFFLLLMSLLCMGWMPCFSAPAPVRTTERKVLYPSVDQNGDTLTLSGKIRMPLDTPAKGIVLLPHFTVLADCDAPSNNGTGEAKYIPEEYIVLMPDYIGYGVTKERIHPYLAGELTARNCVDMLRTDSLPQGLPLYIAGYSQGAATAMWILKLLEEQYAESLPVAACFAGSGPYDVASIYDENIAQNRTTLPMLIPLLLAGTNEAYGLNLRMEDFYTPAMQRAFVRNMEEKKKGVLAVYFRMLNHRMEHWLKPQGRDKTHPDTRRLYDAFLRSSLVHYPVDDSPIGQDPICPSWQPRAPLYVFHSTTDDVVPFSNAEHLRRCFADASAVTYDFGKYGNHMQSMPVFFTHVHDALMEAISTPK